MVDRLPTSDSDPNSEHVFNFPIRRGAARGPSRKKSTPPRRSSSPLFVPQDPSEGPRRNGEPPTHTRGTRRAVAVVIPRALPGALDKYVEIEGADEVRDVLRALRVDGEIVYEAMFGDTHTEILSRDELLDKYSDSVDPADDDMKKKLQKLRLKFESKEDASASEEVNSPRLKINVDSKRGRRRSTGHTVYQTEEDSEEFEEPEQLEESEQSEESASDDSQPRRTSRRLRQNKKRRLEESRSVSGRSQRLRTRRTRSLYRTATEEEDDESSNDDGIPLLESDILPSRKRKRKQLARPADPRFTIRGMAYDGNSKAARRSDRSTKTRAQMTEIDIDQIERSGSEAPRPVPKATGAREAFKPLPRGNAFRVRHCDQCETCGNENNTSSTLIYCQGCCLAYHKSCIGPRNGREHLVTKVGEGDFVLQCRRCINVPHQKDLTKADKKGIAPSLSRCQDCHEEGAACAPFRKRKTMLQEQKEREENDGEDPIVRVDPSLINNVRNVMFRCLGCWRAFHFHHLPSRTGFMDLGGQDDDERAQQRFIEYSRDWRCTDCRNAPSKVGSIVAWRPVDPESYEPGVRAATLEEDEKEYLIKWEGFSYFRAEWKPGPWVWGVAAHGTRMSFFNKEDGPKMRTEDAIPEDYLCIDIVLDVRYTNIIDYNTDEIDRARIREVDQALLKYKGLGYEDAVWEKVPTPEDGDRWTDFVSAYNDWVLGRYTHVPKAAPLKTRLEKARSQPFAEKKKQPENVIGGELMKYQVDGLNWLYYQWYRKQNGVLADEMGLGKTIQVISFLAMMVHDYNCYPFLIVVPNSTCPNWRREIKKWVPQLRVVAYYGSAAARQMAHDYEMFPGKSRDLRCHVVVTSYEAAIDDTSARFFKSVPWQGLIVDEGQRLKNDKSLLHSTLNKLKIPYRVLLTGTPLQNNPRELFNLLQFLDDKIDAAAMEQQYSEDKMTNEKVAEIHNLIRPFVLRRTKAQVLTFLPPMAQIIVPLSMSVLQKKLYKNIMAKSPELIKSLLNQNLKATERASLNNIMMQLRKCLCHPFVYNEDIEEKKGTAAVLHRNLVEASSKLQLLELLLPKLRDRGHRVLIFSQFINMLDIMEDFLDGLEMRYQRLDGNVSSLEKQKRIDEFNAEDSSLFVFLLSTRAGGVGINLATADTVIILDPDWNPHQDIQALSRAHRIGQTKKVLCFQLMTRDSAEEKIVQIGRKKMALDHVVVEALDADDADERDVQSILRHGAAALFDDDNPAKEIKYDNASIEKLLDRSQIENTRAGDDNSAESQFSFARIWANDQSTLQDSLNASEDEQAPPDLSVWDKIIKEREKVNAEMAAAAAKALGRGKRQKMAIDYNLNANEGAVEGAEGSVANAQTLPDITPEKPSTGRRRKSGDSDTDFKESESSDEESVNENEPVTAEELQNGTRHSLSSKFDSQLQGAGPLTIRQQQERPSTNLAPFTRAIVEPPRMPPNPNDHTARMPNGKPYPPLYFCQACNQTHPQGSCPLKIAGPEFCNLCRIAHFGHGRLCPHIKSETMVTEMINAVRMSNEPKNLKEAALKYLRGVKGTLVQAKKLAREKAERAASPQLASTGETSRQEETVEERLKKAWEEEYGLLGNSTVS